MKVKEVIKALEKMDQELNVVSCRYDDEYDYLTCDFYHVSLIQEMEALKDANNEYTPAVVFFEDARIDNLLENQERRIINAITKEFRSDFHKFLQEKTKEFLREIKC